MDPVSADPNDPFANGANPFAAIAAAANGGASPDTSNADQSSPAPLPGDGAPLTVRPASSSAPTSPSSSAPQPSTGSLSDTDVDTSDPFANGANPFAAIAAASKAQQAPPVSSSPGPLANSPDDGFLSGTLKNIGTTAIRGLSHIPGFVGDIGDFADALTEVPEYVESKITGQPFADVVAKRNALAAQSNAAVSADQQGAFGFSLDPRHYAPSGAQVAAPILNQTGAYQPTTPLGKFGSAAGEAVLGGLGPGGGAMAKGIAENAAPGLLTGLGNMARGAVQHAPTNAAAGISSQAAADATGGDPLAASLAGIGASGVIGAGHDLVVNRPQRTAAAMLAKNTSDPQAALSAIQQGQRSPIAGVQPTTAELTGDAGIGRMQDLASSPGARAPQFQQRQREQGRGLATAMDSLQPGGDPQQVATFFSQHFDDIGDRTQAIVDGHLAQAQTQADALRGQGLPVDAYGTTLRNNIATVEDARNKAEGQLWSAVDPQGNLTNDMTGIKSAGAQIYGDMPAADRKFMSPTEQDFSDLVNGYGNVEPFRQVASLKSNLAAAMRQELRDNGSTPAYGRMSRLMGPVQDAINGTVAQRAAADNAAVAAGAMAPENTLAAKLQDATSAYLTRQRNTGADAGAGAVATGTGDATGLPPVPGGESQGGLRSGNSARPQAISADVAGVPRQVGSGAPGGVRPVYHPGGALGVRNELAEHGDLITSHDADFQPRADYPQNLQPRARDSAGARDQVNGMAARLQPERLGPSPEANSGAPIVGPDNVVESGNGRTMAIGKAYDAGRGDAYRQNLHNLGYDTSGYAKPVLIGRRITPMTPEEREYFTHAANDATALRMGLAEQAAADARKITPAMLDSQVGPNIAAAANRPFVGAFMAKLPAAERGALVDRVGGLSQAGVRRVQAALAAHAYDDRGVLSKAFDDPDPNVKGLVGALTDAAGPWAKMRNAISDGTISADHDVTPELMQGVKLAMRARDEGRPIGEMLAQGDLFNSDTSRLVTGMLTKDGSRLASRPQIEANLRAYAEEAVKNGTGDRLFGAAAPVNDVLKASQARAARESGSGANAVFSDVPPPPTANYDAAAVARYQAANAATKENARIYGAKPIADVLAEQGGRGNYKVPASAVPGRLFTKGPGGFENVQAFRQAIGNDRAAMHILRDHALDDLQRTARMSDGTLDEGKLRKWQADHADALRAYPELATQLESTAAASRTLTQASAQRRDLIKAYQKSTFGKLMNASHPDEVNGIIGAALNRPDRVMTFRKLTQAASADPVAMAGLRQSVLEHVVGKSVADIEGATGATRTLKAKSLMDLYNQTHLALQEVLDEPSMAMLRNVTRMAPRVAQQMEPAGKQHADLMRFLKTTARPHESLLERMWKPAIALEEFRKIGAGLAGEWGEMLANGGAGIAIGKKAISAIRATGARKVGDLITDALLNPEQYAALMHQAPPRPDTGSAATLAYQLRRAAMYGGDAMSGIAGHLATRAPRFADRADEQRRRRQPARADGGRVGDRAQDLRSLNDLPRKTWRDVPGSESAWGDQPARAAGGRVEPSEAQLRAGNYQKRHVRFAGFNVSVENEKGAERSGVAKDGRRWSVRMPAAYGYVKGTVGADGDHVDCYLGPDERAPDAFIIDQVELPSRRFDEHKVMLGFASERDAVSTYAKGFSDDKGSARIGKVTRMPIDRLHDWIRSSAALKPTRARGGGIFGGGGPFGVPTHGQMFGPGQKEAGRLFADGGAVTADKDADAVEKGARAFIRQARDVHLELKHRDRYASVLDSLPQPDPVEEALRVATRH